MTFNFNKSNLGIYNIYTVIATLIAVQFYFKNNYYLLLICTDAHAQSKLCNSQILKSNLKYTQN
jgi:hypothetical protein